MLKVLVNLPKITYKSTDKQVIYSDPGWNYIKKKKVDDDTDDIFENI